MTTSKDFNYAVILSLATERVFCEFSQIHEAIEWMYGGPVWTHHIPVVWPEIKAALFKQYPELEKVAEMVNQYAHDYQIKKGG